MIISQMRAYLLAVTAARYAARPGANRGLLQPGHLAALCWPLTAEQRATVAQSLTAWGEGHLIGGDNDEAWRSWQDLASTVASEQAYPAAVVDVDPAVLRPVTTAALRYALGRSTYIVSELGAAIQDMAADLGPAHLAALRADIVAATARQRLGWVGEPRAWLDLAAWLDAYLALGEA